jgi:hypothetical protein
VRLRQLAPRHERREADALVGAQQRELHGLARRGHREHPAVVIEADLGGTEPETPAQAELLGEPDHAVVGGQDHVVEAVHARPARVDRADEAAQLGRTFVEGHLDPGLGQPQGGGHPEDPAADYADRRCHVAGARRWLR